MPACLPHCPTMPPDRLACFLDDRRWKPAGRAWNGMAKGIDCKRVMGHHQRLQRHAPLQRQSLRGLQCFTSLIGCSGVRGIVPACWFALPMVGAWTVLTGIAVASTLQAAPGVRPVWLQDVIHLRQPVHQRVHQHAGTPPTTRTQP